MSRFSERFRGHGFDPLAMTPVYGLAEATLGVAFTPVGRGPRVEGIAREALYARGIAQPARGPEAMQAVSSGVPIPGFEVRIVDDAGREAPDRQEGEVEFRGPGVTGGYLRNAEATRALFHDTWARSGDRGYLADGELYITGRNKDVVIRGGRNLYPYALEQAIAEVEGVRRGCVAVFGSADPDGGTERLVVLVETRERDPARRDELRARVASLTHEHLDLAADEVVLAPPHTVLKTSSGKIRRAALAERHARGRLVTRTRAPWLQVLGLAADSVVPTLRRSARRFAAGAYAVWFAMVLAINVLWAWPAVVLVPGTRRSWTIARLASRSVLALAGIRLQVRGEATFDDRRGMLVVNHQSYLDGLVLVASLDAPVAFVVKRELRSSRFARPFLDALGVLYVERFERERSVGDARRVADALVRGTRVAFFPEGTFHRMPGLLPFQLGAFEAAVATATAVQPVLIAGTRHVLRGNEFFARRGAVEVRFLEPVAVGGIEDGGRWKAAVALREKVREMMLCASAEPDLAMRDALAELTERRREQGGR
jgi:1-acyl-sn-glycerol-3-phosphate acyltransferase